MADNKMGPNIQAGAGIFAKRVQKSLNRAQEKVLQKLGKAMETKDEQFEQCSQNLSKQQIDATRLFKDVRAYHTAVKAMHESSKRLSQTLKDVYEPDWNGGEDLSVIMESEDLLWNDYEEKLSDQIVRTMENYSGQFPEVKERVAKRGRKLVDYDSTRHHLEALQSAKKKDDAKIAKAEEEFNKAQNVFEEINKELREELPVLYQSRIGCYVTVFQNISNLRDVFYKEMSVLNHELYNVMKKLETQHSGKTFIIKGLSSAKTKKRKSLVISNPIPCNTAFPADHVSIHASTQNGEDAKASTEDSRPQSISEEPALPEDSESGGTETTSGEDAAADFEDLGSSTDIPERQSLCNSENSDGSIESQNLEEVEPNSSQSDDSGVEVPRPEVARQEAGAPSTSADADVTERPESGNTPGSAQKEVKAKAPPVPKPRLSSHSRDIRTSAPAQTTEGEDKGEGAHEMLKMDDSEKEMESKYPPGFLYKAVAMDSQEKSEDGFLQFEKGDIILVVAESLEQGVLKGIQEQSWNQHKDLDHHSGIFPEDLIQPVGEETGTHL